jgi:hypothetical protein
MLPQSFIWDKVRPNNLKTFFWSTCSLNACLTVIFQFKYCGIFVNESNSTSVYCLWVWNEAWFLIVMHLHFRFPVGLNKVILILRWHIPVGCSESQAHAATWWTHNINCIKFLNLNMIHILHWLCCCLCFWIKFVIFIKQLFLQVKII